MKKNSGPPNIIFSNNITKDSYTNGILDNTFIIFNSIYDLLYFIYSKRKSIILYNLINNKKINEIKNAHNEDISNFRHYLDKTIKIDLVISLSKNDNNIKLWNIKNLECLHNIKRINENGWLYSSCFLNDNNKTYIVTSNWSLGNSEYIKVFDLKGNKVKKINNSNDKTFFIDSYYDNNLLKNYIITSNKGYIKSYDYNNNKIFHKYCDDNDDDHTNLIIYNKNEIIQLIDSCSEGTIRIWHFNTGELLNKIKIKNIDYGLTGICLWNDEYIFIGSQDKTIKLVEIKNGKIIKNLNGHTECLICIKKIIHPIYGECLISQGRRYDQIKLWINKN